MTRQTAQEWLPGIFLAMLLILTAWGNALAMFTASLLGLVVGLVLFRREQVQGVLLAAALGCVVALIVSLVIWLK